MSEKLNETIKNLYDTAAHPAKSVAAAMEKTGKRAVGCVAPYAPEEIIDAAGYLPVGLWGGEVELKKARTFLPPFACSIMQSIMEMENDDTYDVLSAVLIPAVCDTLKCFGQKWKGKCPAIPFVHPQHRNMPGAIDFLANEYENIRKQLQDILDVTITDDALSVSIMRFNHCRQVCGPSPRWPLNTWMLSRRRCAMALSKRITSWMWQITRQRLRPLPENFANDRKIPMMATESW